MKVYNTFSRKKEEFSPLQKGKVGMYVCGPTVYDFGHLGHGRAAVSFDVIRKYLLYSGYNVTFVTNYTDIDDKIIQRAELLKITASELAARIIPEYKRDYEALGIMEGDVEPKAMEHVEEMVAIIVELEEKGFSYVLDDGVYFDVSRFERYGKLSRQKLDELKSGLRVAVNSRKRNPQDFVLWKFSKSGEPEWESPWGAGRPGWHIECSAMSSKYLGTTFDIHGGGADLIFPHHECEIAQSEAFSGKALARYWLHNGFINLNNEKMSKSLGNFFTLRDIFKKFSPQAVRYLFLQTHYRSPIEFSDKILQQAANGLARVHDFMGRLANYSLEKPNGKQLELVEFVEHIEERFKAAMEDDFETPQALAACFDLIKEVNRRIDARDLTRDSKELLMTVIMRLDAVLGIFVSTQSENIDEEIMALIEARNRARASKNWKEADRIRKELLAKGIQLEDTSGKTVWKRV